MKKVSHPNCVHLFNVVMRDDVIFLVLELVDGGPSQVTHADGRGQPLAERAVWSHTRHLVLGLEYLHMHGIVHHDIKPENLLVTRRERMLKIADFGTSCFAEGLASSRAKTVGTPAFFAPELCAQGTVGTFDQRSVDLWAVGVTLHLWLSGVAPFQAPTMMLLLEQIREAPPSVAPPPGLPAALGSVLGGLLTRDTSTRLTLNQLRMHSWLTDGDALPLPQQPVPLLDKVTPEEIEQAFSHRRAIAYQSAAGPGTLGRDVGLIPDWRREGANTICKRTSSAEAAFYRAITSSGHLAPHIPVVYSIDRLVGDDGDDDTDEGGGGERRASVPTATQPMPRAPADAGSVYEIRMQDLAAGMTRPCAMRFVMGCRTVVASDFAEDAVTTAATSAPPGAPAPPPDASAASPPDAPVADGTAGAARLNRMRGIDRAAAEAFLSDEERTRGEVSRRRYLSFVDGVSSTASLGFRIDAAMTLVGGEMRQLPLPDGVCCLEGLQKEAQLEEALATFVQRDGALARAVLRKLQAVAAAQQRCTFFRQHVFVRSALLLTYDDTARYDRFDVRCSSSILLPPGEAAARRLPPFPSAIRSRSPLPLHRSPSGGSAVDPRLSPQLKMINFGWAYRLPDGAPPLTHIDAWDGAPTSHEDGYLMGFHSLIRLTQRVCDALDGDDAERQSRLSRGSFGGSGKSASGRSPFSQGWSTSGRLSLSKGK